MNLTGKVAKNAYWIIGCRIARAVFGMAINLLTARYLGPSGYGIISYASSLVAFILPIATLGINNVMVNEFIKRPDEEGKIIGTSVGLTLVSSFFCIVGLLSFVAVANNGEIETFVVCALYSTVLFLQCIDLIQYWYQAKLLSKYYSIVSLVAYLLVSLYKAVLLICGSSVYWFALTNSFDYIIIVIALYAIYFREGKERISFSFDVAKRLISQSKYYIIADLMVTVYGQTDRIMLKMILGSDEVGYYSVAASISGLTAFVFVAIIDSMRPIILDYKVKGDTLNYENSMARLYGIVTYLALLQSVFITLFSYPIVHLLYGDTYHASIEIVRILVWYTTFSYLGGARTIWILAEEKQKYLFLINCTGALLNVVLNFVLIPICGAVGAALASLVTQIFTNFIIGFIIKPIIQNNLLMLKGLNLKILFGIESKEK